MLGYNPTAKVRISPLRQAIKKKLLMWNLLLILPELRFTDTPSNISQVTVSTQHIFIRIAINFTNPLERDILSSALEFIAFPNVSVQQLTFLYRFQLLLFLE